MAGTQTEIESSSLDRCDAAYQNGAKYSRQSCWLFSILVCALSLNGWENRGEKLFGPIYTSTPKVQTTARTATNALETLQNWHEDHLVQLWQAQKKREVRKMCPACTGSFVHYIERGGLFVGANSANGWKGRATISPLQCFLFCRRKRSQRAPCCQIQSLAVKRRWKRWACLDWYRYETAQIAKRLIFLKYCTRA